MNLAEFMDEIGARPIDVAKGAGIDASIVVRVRDEEQVPSGITLMKLNRWAEQVAKKRRLPRQKRLSWDHLLDGAA